MSVCQSVCVCQWRDHWMQAVYYPACHLVVSTNQQFTLHSYHDDYSLWFDVSQHESRCYTQSHVIGRLFGLHLEHAVVSVICRL